MRKLFTVLCLLLAACAFADTNIIYGDFTSKLNYGEIPTDVTQFGALDNVSRVNFIGDSITHGSISGYGKVYAGEYSIPGLVEKYTGVETRNYGIDGACLSTGLNAICNAINKIEFLPNDITVVCVGVNDCGAKVDTNTYCKAWSILLTNWFKKKQEGSRLVIATVLPENNIIISKSCMLISDVANYTYTYSVMNRAVYNNFKNYNIYLADIEKAVTDGVLHSARSSEGNKLYYGNNGLHPNYSGYAELGRWYSDFLIKNFGHYIGQ